ncbi:MAG TPA: hypothetical protein H9909_04985 [Candidatus Mediterraneibacter norfolkensis]|nr:hypothetical protein [Candidatus Mediterraneibacter norfolkensis]
MPFYDVRVSRKLDTELKKILADEFGKAIELLPGKKYHGTEVEIRDGSYVRMLSHPQEESAYIELKIFGHYEQEQYDVLSREIFRIMQERIRIKPENIYIVYSELLYWGVAREIM